MISQTIAEVQLNISSILNNFKYLLKKYVKKKNVKEKKDQNNDEKEKVSS